MIIILNYNIKMKQKGIIAYRYIGDGVFYTLMIKRLMIYETMLQLSETERTLL